MHSRLFVLMQANNNNNNNNSNDDDCDDDGDCSRPANNSIPDADPTILTNVLHEQEIEQQHHHQEEEEHDDLMVMAAAAAAASNVVSHKEHCTSWGCCCRCCYRYRLFFRYNAFFLGSLFATIASLSDLQSAWKDFQKDDDDDDNDKEDDEGHNKSIVYEQGGYFIVGGENDQDKREDGEEGGYYSNVSPWRYWTLYKVLAVASTFMYLLDSLIHIFFTGSDSDDNNEDHNNNNNNTSDSSSSSSSSMHSRMAFSIVFGVAASLDLVSCVLEDDYTPWPAYYFGTAAVDLFLLSALMTLVANKNVYVTATQKWLLLGDLFFLAGSVVDVCVNYWDYPNAPDSGWLWVACWSLVSSLLWLVDSIIYRWADEDLFEQPVVHHHHHHVMLLNTDDTDTEDREDENNVVEHQAEIDVHDGSSCCNPAAVIVKESELSSALLQQRSSPSDVLTVPSR